MKAIIGKKIGMTQIFDEQGKVIPVTVVVAGPCWVVEKRTVDRHGYDAIQIGFDPADKRFVTVVPVAEKDPHRRNSQPTVSIAPRNENPQPLVIQEVGEWRRRESNPRPEIFPRKHLRV